MKFQGHRMSNLSSFRCSSADEIAIQTLGKRISTNFKVSWEITACAQSTLRWADSGHIHSKFHLYFCIDISRQSVIIVTPTLTVIHCGLMWVGDFDRSSFPFLTDHLLVANTNFDFRSTCTIFLPLLKHFLIGYWIFSHLPTFSQTETSKANQNSSLIFSVYSFATNNRLLSPVSSLTEWLWNFPAD